jgi:hypothetical protein
MDMISTALRRVSRALVPGLALGVLLLAAPAEARPPSTWDEPRPMSTPELLLVLVGVPILVFLVLALLVYLPSMIRGRNSEPGVAFQERSEWFGGPRKGVGGAPEAPTGAGDKGGASARW